jgi:hypothetical protein
MFVCDHIYIFIIIIIIIITIIIIIIIINFIVTILAWEILNYKIS